MTDGAGCIGSHTVLALLKAGYGVVVLDNLVYRHQELVEDILQVKLVVADTNDRITLDRLFATTKWIRERMLADFDRAYDVQSVVFRFFNASGANPEGLWGEDHNPETHLIPLVLLTALGKRESISIFRHFSCIKIVFNYFAWD